MSEQHGDIDRKEHYFIIKAWKQEDGSFSYSFDHDAAELYYPNAVWNNKIGEWIDLNKNEDLMAEDQNIQSDIYNKLGMVQE